MLSLQSILYTAPYFEQKLLLKALLWLLTCLQARSNADQVCVRHHLLSGSTPERAQQLLLLGGIHAQQATCS